MFACASPMSALQFATDLQLICGRASGAEDFETLQAQGNQMVSLFWQLLASVIGQQYVRMYVVLWGNKSVSWLPFPVLEGKGCLT